MPDRTSKRTFTKTKRHLGHCVAAAISILLAGAYNALADEFAASLPKDVKPVWDLAKAYRESTPTRERLCINGLWRWQPAEPESKSVPAAHWGYFKVPGCWPGITDYLQKDCQTVYSHPNWKGIRLGSTSAAWYQREIAIPSHWAGRRIALAAEGLNSVAFVYVDSARAGEIRFPGGELELTAVCRPASRHVLSMLVVAQPLRDVLLAYNDTAAGRQVRGTVPRRGLCGDLYLISMPLAARIGDVKVETKVRQGRISFDVALTGLAPDARYSLRGRITDGSRTVIEPQSERFAGKDVQNGRFRFSTPWKPDRLWDVNRPENMYSLSVSLLVPNDEELDTAFKVRFGFREFWIDGRDFYLNGTRIFLSAVPLDNAQVSAAHAGYAGARESLERLKSFGINFVYTHNYGCEPGSHLSFAEILRAADDVGMLVALSQPHFSHYEWRAPEADGTSSYARHAEAYVRVAQNHPSVVFYAMSHNATGYDEDMNPDFIDGLHDPREAWSRNNSKLALRAEAIVHRLDPDRIVYHHSSGNLGSMHTSNFYPNFAPIQELSDWFEHWASAGAKPVFTCEYGAPFSWDWAMYRGWYKGQRSFGSARVPWEFCLAEWNAQFLGDRAFRITELERANLRWEARQFRSGSVWHRWDYPSQLGSRLFEDRNVVMAMYLTDNWRAFRTWGVSAISPWEYGNYWAPRAGLDRSRKPCAVDWEHLQRPGFSPDFVDEQYERIDLAFERSDWIPNAAGKALSRNNLPLLAYIGGEPGRVTSKDHNFRAGETLEKQIVVINNSRETVLADCRWSLELPQPAKGGKRVTMATGQIERVLIRIPLPAASPSGTFDLRLAVDFSTGQTQDDSFAVQILPAEARVPAAPSPTNLTARTAPSSIALFDREGETKKLLDEMGISHRAVDATADLSPYDVLIVGKRALTIPGPAPRIDRVRDGLKVLVFEQTAQVLERRFGFRAHEYGLRQVYPRIPDHPLLSGIGPAHLRDWRGEATLVPSRLQYKLQPGHGPTVTWCDIPVTRVWRCGNSGNVASALIEKPACGDFLPILDGGFSLQYSPLLLYREGLGLVLFCQLDITGRTENDPAAQALARNMIEYVCNSKSTSRRTAVYAGELSGLRQLKSAGVSVRRYSTRYLSRDAVLVVGPGGASEVAADKSAIADWLKAGGNLLAVGIDDNGANSFLPFPVQMKKGEHISAYFGPFGAGSLLAGIGPADVHNRDPRDLALLTAGATVIGNGVLARADGMNVVFCQLVPWQYNESGKSNVKRTFRRASFLVSRLLAEMGVSSTTPILDRFATPVLGAESDRRWLAGLYLDRPDEWDDPYRFFRW
jgi:hypothetical protein